MKQCRLILLVFLTFAAVVTASAQFSPRKDYIWARDISVSASPTITIDGVLNEQVWAQAESLVIMYGQTNGTPGDGWKIMNGTGTPHDPANAVIKFLCNKNTNMLYVAVIAKDSSVGGAGWEKSDGVLCGMYDRTKRATNGITLHRDIFISWADSGYAQVVGAGPHLTGGDLPGHGIVIAGASVQGLSNSDTDAVGQRVADQGWTIEFAVYLDSLGYHANSDTTDAVQMNVCIWDMDWFNASDFIATRAWWGHEWGNDGGGTAERVLVRNDVNVNTSALPAYNPDFVIPNGQNYPDITVDGNLTEEVWAKAPSIDLQYGNTALKASYPTIGPDRSGQWVTTPGVLPFNAGLANVKMFFKGDMLYVGADVSDRSLNSFGGDPMFDGLSVSLSVPIDSLRDAVVHQMAGKRFGVAVKASGPIAIWDAVDYLGKGFSFGVALKPGSTIDDNFNVDAGYTIEMALDLTAIGYPPGGLNKTVAMGVNYSDYDISPTLTSAYHVWWFREYPLTASPAFCLLDNSDLLTGVGDQTKETVVKEFRLFGNYPNPFNPSTTIRLSLPGAGTATLNVFDILGRCVSRSTFGVAAGGTQERLFDASSLATGVYYYRVEFVSETGSAKQVSETKKMLLVR
jgi:hypothetical protein